MAHEIPEPDWKLLRKLHPLALERFCERVLDEVGGLAADPGKSAHERYRAVYKLLRHRDKELADAFDDMRRSAAWRRLAVLRALGLLTEGEFAGFSPETRDVVQIYLG
jgi:hypothetical protein